MSSSVMKDGVFYLGFFQSKPIQRFKIGEGYNFQVCVALILDNIVGSKTMEREV